MHEGPLLVADHDVGLAVAIDVAGHHLRAHAGVAIDLVWREAHHAVGAPQLEPGQLRALAVGAVAPAVREVAVAGDEVHQAVAVHVDGTQRVQVADHEAVRVLARLAPHDLVLLERDLGASAHLLEPGEPVAVRVVAGDHVVVAIAVDVEHQHLRAAVAGERDRVGLPGRVTVQRRRLPPPAVLPEHVVLAVAVDVTHAEPMREAPTDARDRQRMPGPRLLGRAPVDHRVAEPILVLAHQLGPAVADEIRKVGRLVVDALEHHVLWPVPSRPAWVLVPRRVLAGEADHQHVVPAVGVEVVHEGEEVVGVHARLERCRRIQLVHLRELRALVPERTRHDVGLAVPVEVAKGRPLAEEPRLELLLREGADLVLGGEGRAEDDERECFHERVNPGSFLIAPPANADSCARMPTAVQLAERAAFG